MIALKKPVFLLFITFLVASCLKEEDPGPLQSDSRDFSIADFDRLDMGDAFDITVQQGPIYSIHVSGDRRNLDALSIQKSGSTLKASYNDQRNRNHTTYFVISLPNLVGANLTGATNSTISGFKNVDKMELTLSGASICHLNMEAKEASVNLSGASKLTALGKSDMLVARVSGASELYAYDLPVISADADASGASKINVFASQTLKATASGASTISYRGNPSVNSSASGASTVKAD